MRKKLALIGGPEINKYTVADELWKIISKTTGERFSFRVVSIKSKDHLCKFYNDFLHDDSFVGFNTALPWKNVVSKMVDYKDLVYPGIDSINTVYKDIDRIVGINTDVEGIDRSLEMIAMGKTFRKILVIGVGGAGLPTACYLTNKYGVGVHIYDIKLPAYIKNIHNIFILKSLSQLFNCKYDLIINATPLGKYHRNSKIESFTSPLDIDILSKIINTETVLQEMNYFPTYTLFLQIGKTFGLTCIPGYLMLTFQAIASFEKYFHRKISAHQVGSIIENIVDYIKLMEENTLGTMIK